MITLKQIAHRQWVILGAVIGLALYYVLIFRPLSQRAAALDKPVEHAWQELVDFSKESSSIRDLDLGGIRRTQEMLRASLAATEKVRNTIFNRVQLEPETRAKMAEPFSLIDFQNERQERIEQLNALARNQKVVLNAAALQGFPEYNAETKDPGLLWAQLSVASHILAVAINSKVQEVKNVTVLPTQAEKVPNSGEVSWQMISLRVELVSAMPAAENFLAAMPLRSEELKAAGLPESLPGKPALFLDRVLLRKQTPEKPDDLSLDVVISGFVPGSKAQRDPFKGKEALR